MSIERRFIKSGETRAKEGDKPAIEGVGAVYNQNYDSGWFVENMKPGAFSRALSEKQDVRCLFNHDPNNVLGRTKSGTLRISDASDGLHYECDTDPDTRIATDVHAMIQRGDVDGCSISFTVRKQVWREETDEKGNSTLYRDIEDVDLFDVGPVTFPAYEQTSVSARSLWPDGVPAEVRSHVPALEIIKAPAKRDEGDDNTCTCECDPCEDGDCAGCNCESGCESTTCLNADCRCDAASRMRMRLRIAESSL